MNPVNAFIFDLDMTLVDSSKVEHLRESRRWSTIRKNLDDITLYPTIKRTLDLISRMNIPWAVVTSSPESYCRPVLEFLGLKPDVTVCYHDTNKHKPHPAPLFARSEERR